MTTKLMMNGALALAGVLLSAGMAHAEKPAWCTNGVLMETLTYNDGAAARDYINAHGSTATINGVTHEVIGTVNIVVYGASNRVYVVEIWDCTKEPPVKPGGDKNNGGGASKEGKEKEKVTYTLDPHPELDRNGKRR